MTIGEHVETGGVNETAGDLLGSITSHEARQDVSGDVITVAEDRAGPYAIVEPRARGDTYAASRAAGILTNHLRHNQFNPSSPNESIRDAFVAMNADVAQRRSGGDDNPGVMASVVRLFDSHEEGLQVAFGIIGNDQIYLQRPQDETGRYSMSRAITPTPDNYGAYLTGEESDLRGVAIGVVNVRPGDRLIIVSSAVEESAGAQLKEQVIEVTELDRTMRSLVTGPTDSRDKVALGIQVGQPAVDEVPTGLDGLLSSDSQETGDSRTRRGFREWLGGTALGAAAASRLRKRRQRAAATEILQPAEERIATETPIVEPVAVDVSQDNSPGWRDRLAHYRQVRRERRAGRPTRTGRLGSLAIAATTPAVVYWQGRDDRRRERQERRYEGMDEVQIAEYEARNSRLRRIGLIVGGVALAAIAYRLSFDIGDGHDKGIDLWPFGNGDKGQGDSRGWDINWSNRSPFLNDDPTIPHWDSSGSMDLLPSWADGDPMDPLHWPWTPDVHHHFVPGTNGAGHVPAGPGTGSGGSGNIPPPAAQPPAAPPVPTGIQPAEHIYVEPGSGFDREIQEYAATKGRTVSDPQAYRMYLEGRSNFGDNGLITDQATYVSPAGDLRIAGVGNAHLTAQMQQLIDADLQKIPA